MTTPPTDLAFLRHAVRFLIVDAADAGVAQWAPPGSVGSAGAAPDVRYCVEPWRPSWGATGGRYRVSRDGALRFLGSAAGVARWVLADVEKQAWRRAGGSLRVGADAVLWRGRAILIPRRGRRGTSTLVAALLRGGALPGAERIVVLDPAGCVQLDDGARAESPPPVALVVAATYRPALSWQPQVVTGTRAVLPIIDSALVDTSQAAHLLGRAARLASGLVTLQGARGEAAEAAPRILAALDQLLGDEPPVVALPSVPRLLARARQAIAACRGDAVAGDLPEIG